MPPAAQTDKRKDEGISMTFNDVFKSSFLDSFSSFSFLDTALSPWGSIRDWAVYLYVYQKTYSGVLYSRSFNVSFSGDFIGNHIGNRAVTSNVVLSGHGRRAVYRAFPYCGERSDGFGVLFWAIAWYSLRRKPSCLLALLGCPILGHLPACFCKSSAEG